ncbi:MAG TPA: hypothetical protein VJL85_02550 [Gaiellaceae bacterium]|jgi:hypothetical protein|nr:hypothetical protein [Gaiellaceae bacterium]
MTTPTHPRGREPSDRGRSDREPADRKRRDRKPGDRKPTVRQVYALAAALAERLGEEFPATAAEASELIERLRIENGHPAPRLEDTPPRPRRTRR